MRGEQSSDSNLRDDIGEDAEAVEVARVLTEAAGISCSMWNRPSDTEDEPVCRSEAERDREREYEAPSCRSLTQKVGSVELLQQRVSSARHQRAGHANKTLSSERVRTAGTDKGARLSSKKTLVSGKEPDGCAVSKYRCFICSKTFCNAQVGLR